MARRNDSGRLHSDPLAGAGQVGGGQRLPQGNLEKQRQGAEQPANNRPLDAGDYFVPGWFFNRLMRADLSPLQRQLLPARNHLV